MSATVSPPGDRRAGPDEFDRMMTAFFRSEMPSPWPALSAPATVRPAGAVYRRASSRSRLVLAASVTALLAGSWYLSGRLLGPLTPGASPGDGTATVPLELRQNSQPPPR